MVERNIFSLGRNVGKEDQLTEYLAWLVETLPAVGATLIDLALAQDSARVSDEIRVRTQQTIPGRRLDAVLETEAVRLVIESKLDSDYGRDQLEDYLQCLAENPEPAQERVLMTLTKRAADWPPVALLRADQLGVRARPARWENLYKALGALADTDILSDLAVQLVEEFRDLLAQEGLVPMPPLNGPELGESWQQARNVIDRFHAYYRASEKTIADALGASAFGRRSLKPEQASMTFWFDSIASGLAVGIYAAGADWKRPPGSSRDAPVLFAAFWGDAWKSDSGFVAMANHLESTVPADWFRSERLHSCPCILRYLDETLGHGSFDEQQLNLANAVRPLGPWVESAFSAIPPKPKRRFH